MPNRFRWNVAKSVCRITNLEESLLPVTRQCRSPLAHWVRSPSGADCRCRRGRGPRRLGWRRRRASGACLRGCRIRDRKLIDQEGNEIVGKLLGLALVAGIVVGVKKYLDNNPEAKRQVKEQANRAMGQAKHLAEGAADKVKARTSQAQDQVDSFTGAATSGSTSSTSSATTPIDPATGAPTTLQSGADGPQS
jgi:hypothetical protein